MTLTDNNCCDPICGANIFSDYTLPLKFYAVKGKKKRPRGKGCLSCVHQPYCIDFYWLRRNLEYSSSFTNDYGTSCGSWSNNKADYIHTPTLGDLQTNERMKNMGIQQEKDENGVGIDA